MAERPVVLGQGAGPDGHRLLRADRLTLRFHYRAWGDPLAPAVLLLHGLTGNAWEWDPIATALARDRHVIALDQRGHGGTEWTSDYAPERMAEDAGAMIEALGGDPVALVGHSMGALNALLLAARRPELVMRLAIVDFGPDSMGPQAIAEWAVALRAAADETYDDPEQAVTEWLARNPRAREAELRHFVVHNLARGDDGRHRWRFDAGGLGSFLEQIPGEPEQWEAARAVARPVLVVRGAHSGVLSARTAARMVRQIGDCRLVEIPEGAHDLTVEEPQALTRALDRFLS